HGIGPARTREVEGQVSGHVPDEVFAAVETGGRLRVQYRAGARIEHVDALSPRRRIPVEEIKRDLVRLAVLQVDVDRKRRTRVPGGSNAVGRVRGLGKVAHVRGGGGPGVVALAARGHQGVARVAHAVVDDVVALDSVGTLPAPLGGGVGLDEGGRRRGWW